MKDNTVIVIWSDHGFHIGEKENWEKFALWDQTTHTPLFIHAPGVGTDGARTLWDLQALLLQGGSAAAPGYDAVRQRLRPALIEQMRRCPIPTTVWRERAGSDAPDDPTGTNEPGKIVVGLHGVMQDPAAHELMMWGGAWRGDGTYPALQTPHACPGYGLSTGVLLGLVAGLLLAGSLSLSPSPSIVYWRR